MATTTTESVSRRLRLAIGVNATVTFLQPVISRVASVSASSGSISGAVFLDKDSDGTKAGGEAGLAGVEVKAFDSTGVLGRHECGRRHRGRRRRCDDYCLGQLHD